MISTKKLIDYIIRRFKCQYFMTKYKCEYRRCAPEPTEIIFINPMKVDYMIVPQFKQNYPYQGSYIIGGEWDKRKHDTNINYYDGYEKVPSNRGLVQLTEYTFLQSVKNRFQKDSDWESTPFYRWLNNNNYLPKKSQFYAKDDRINRFQELDKLANSIRSSGYKLQSEIRNSENSYPLRPDVFSSKPELDEIMINIGRDGELIFEEGRHRFAVARSLQLTEIPVRVFVRHEEWQEIRQEAHSSTEISSLSLDVKEHINHPDIQNLIK